MVEDSNSTTHTTLSVRYGYIINWRYVKK